MGKYLDSGGLSHLMGKIKSWANGAFLKLSGGTMTGKLTLAADRYTDDNATAALDAKNSNIIGVNSIYTADSSDNAQEGIHFYRDATHVDSIHAKAGELYFTPNRQLGAVGSQEKILRETSPVKEAFLTWGGKNFSASYGPIDAAMIGFLGANRLAFSRPAGIAIEYSRDGGTTWTDYGSTDGQKTGLFSIGNTHYIGAWRTGKAEANWKLRVTLTTNLSGTYTVLNKFAFYVTTNGATGANVTITGRTKANLDAGNETWVTFADHVDIDGWSGWNIVNTGGITTYGNSSGQYANVRFEFGITGVNASYSSALDVGRIFGFGGAGWSTPSFMATHGHLYNYDASQNATFPGSIFPKTNESLNLGSSRYKWLNVYSKYLTGDLTGNVKGDVTGNATGIAQANRNTVANYLINSLTTGSSNPVDADYYVSQYASGGTTTTTFHRRPMSALWNYIKGKIQSTLLSSATNSSSEALAATPKAVKAAYDLADGAADTAGRALSAATGAKAVKVAYSISNGTVTGEVHVYSAGSEVTTQWPANAYTWSYEVGAGNWVSLGTGYTKNVALSTLGYGGNLKCSFNDETTS